SENNLKIKLLQNLLTKDLPVTAKILFMLRELDLYTEANATLVSYLTEARNSVAHGRQVYYDKAIYPLQPFFPLISNTVYPLEIVRIFTAHVLGMWLGSTYYDQEWLGVEDSLLPSIQAVKMFLKQKDYE